MAVGGEVYLVAPGGKVLQEALIAASKDDNGGKVVLDTTGGEERTGETTVSGKIGVSGNIGGQAIITGDSVALKEAQADATGVHGGGQINIGGGFQGKDASLANSQSTSVDTDSTIAADALETGDGGTVILWSDGATDYQGNITATGAPLGSGGFVEISGKQFLNFAGLVNTGGGNLLLDPYNYTIDATAAGNIVTALVGNNVTIQTSVDNASQGSSGTDTDPGNITVNSAIVWGNDNDLTLLAHGDVSFNANVQNSAAGDVNVVAGWDGTTSFDATTFLAEDIATTTLFGNNAGSVFIGSASETAGVAVGSAHGNTNVFAHDVILRGSDTNRAYAQLGFHHVDASQTTGTTGNINVLATEGISALAGSQGSITSSQTSSFVQIGHGGNRRESGVATSWNYSGDVTLAANEDILFQGAVPTPTPNWGTGDRSPAATTPATTRSHRRTISRSREAAAGAPTTSPSPTT